MTNAPGLPGLDRQSETVAFTPTRAAGLARLDRFISRAGRHYASRRNYDLGPERRDNVSCLSPWIRHRLITEEEVLRATLARHAPSAAEKFVQEVFWRTYFKGWLEHRPSVWTTYQKRLRDLCARIERDAELAAAYDTAVAGRTGIDCFDHWARELVETGYVHNHARMWFASIWIFTLRLPWELGADFFLRHLMDGDPASNTLSWRWVGGLHTKGKTYQARPPNIATFTEERFRPQGQLASDTAALQEAEEHPECALPSSDRMPPEGRFVLVLTEDDLYPEHLISRQPQAAVALLNTTERSPLPIGDAARAFARGAARDALSLMDAESAVAEDDTDWADALIDAARDAGVDHVAAGYAPVGPVAGRLRGARERLRDAGLALHLVKRPYDALSWPYATRGFFGLKRKVPHILHELGLGA